MAEFDKNAWDMNAETAKKELAEMAKNWNNEQLTAMRQLSAWMHRYTWGTNPCGYKRLSRIILAMFKPE